MAHRDVVPLARTACSAGVGMGRSRSTANVVAVCLSVVVVVAAAAFDPIARGVPLERPLLHCKPAPRT